MAAPDSNQQSPPSVLFEIVYTGRALRNGTMDVQDFAPALLALQRIVEEIHKKVDETGSLVALQINRVEQGSLRIILRLVVRKVRGSVRTGIVRMNSAADLDKLDKILSILVNGPTVIGTVVSGVGTMVSGVIAVVNFLNGEPATSVERSGNTINVYNNTYNYITTDMTTYALATDPVVLQNIALLVQPLRNPGVESLYLTNLTRGRSVEPQNFVYKRDLSSFPLPLQETEETIEAQALAARLQQVASRIATVGKAQTVKEVVSLDDRFEGTFTILDVPLANLNKKWRFGGERTFSAPILDEWFLQQIRTGEIRLLENDELELIVKRKGAGYVVERVVEHISGGKGRIARN
jgi:hypothetical protein